jgi:hypothetical protein
MNEPRYLFQQGEVECYRERFDSLPGMNIDVERKSACQVLCGIGGIAAFGLFLWASWLYTH